jgi:sulfur carrier protein
MGHPGYNSRMNIVLNGETRTLDHEQSLRELLDAAGYRDKRVAVEVNRQIISRSAHADYRICNGDRIEIVHAIGGG